VTDLAQLAEDGETPRNRSLDMGTHHQVGIYHGPLDNLEGRASMPSCY